MILPAADQNAILNLFSAERSRILAGVTRVAGDFKELSSVLTDLIKRYHGELNMPQTLEEMIRISERRVIADLSPTLIAEELPPEKLRENSKRHRPAAREIGETEIGGGTSDQGATQAGKCAIVKRDGATKYFRFTVLVACGP